MTDKANRTKNRRRWLVGGLFVLVVVGGTCLSSRRLRAILFGRSGMQTRVDERVFVEPDVPASWELSVAEALDEAVQRIENAHGREFPKPIEVCLCATQRSYNRRTGDPIEGSARGTVFLNRVLLGPRCWETGTTAGILTHELSHLHLRQVMGSRYTTTVPGWFQEGLAVFVADGAGAEPVSTRAATDAIGKGMELDPEAEGRSIPRMASGHGLRHHMFYRQSAMFVDYLATSWPNEFRLFLDDLQSGKVFSQAFDSRFGGSPKELWSQFTQALLSSSGQTGVRSAKHLDLIGHLLLPKHFCFLSTLPTPFSRPSHFVGRA